MMASVCPGINYCLFSPRMELAIKYRSTVPSPLPFAPEPVVKAVSYADYRALFMAGLAGLAATLAAFLCEAGLAFAVRGNTAVEY